MDWAGDSVPERVWQLRRLGYRVIPLGGKRPMVKWGHLRNQPPNDRERGDHDKMFAAGADIGLICGPASGVICADLDDPEATLPGFSANRTPRGGRHYFFVYHDGDAFGINVKPKTDVPILVRLYDYPFINEGQIPVQPTYRQQYANKTDWYEWSERPSMDAMLGCEFVRWYQDRRYEPDFEGRYPLARAYAALIDLTSDPRPEDKALGWRYAHEEDIYRRLPPAPPSCKSIVNSGYDCPNFRHGCCTVYSVRSPYGFALRRDKNAGTRSRGRTVCDLYETHAQL